MKWCSEACREAHRPKRTRVDTRRRTGDRHTNRPPRRDTRRNRQRAQPRRRFIGVDGESVDDRYVLLAAADDDGWSDWVECPDGLRTADCLQFLARLPDAIVWGFAFGYDVNMMLGDMHPATVLRLYENGRVRWHNFYVEYVPKKMLRVVERASSHKDAVRIDGTVVWDMFPWQQMSFANWLREESLATEREVAAIEKMKNKRATFAASERQAIRRYCLHECEYLARGARKMVDTITAAGFRTGGKFYSPASLAKAEMKRQAVQTFMADPPRNLVAAVESARFGGRAEVGRSGPIDGPVWQHDICSAYPTELAALPCLAHATWKHAAATAPIKPLSLVRVKWRPRLGNGRPTWGPFPMRSKVGSLRFPSSGEGWYWGVEVRAAQRHTRITVLDHWRLVPGCTHQPFGYVPDMYAKRKMLKQAGDPSEYVIKLALNSTYGALAERPHRNMRREPPWRSLVWAGLITAGTRAKMLDVLDESVVMIATDGIFATSRLSVHEGVGLGDWEVERYDALWIAGTGFYFPFRDGEWLKPKTRGFAPYDMPRDELVAQWEADGRVAKVTKTRRRFIGMGTALHRINGFPPPYPGLWRQWIDAPVTKTFDLFPRRQWLSDNVHDGRSRAPTLTMHRQLGRDDVRRLKRNREMIGTAAKKVTVFRNFLAWQLANHPERDHRALAAAVDKMSRLLLLRVYMAEVNEHGIDGTNMLPRHDQPFGVSDA